MANFDLAIKKILANEGGFVDSPYDAGGMTNFGISLRFLKSFDLDAKEDDIRNMTKDLAICIYKNRFWNKAAYAALASQKIAMQIFDHHVNAGMESAIKILQKACNSLLKVTPLKIDGEMGIATIATANELSENSLYEQIKIGRIGFYKQLVIINPDQHIFLDGWIARVDRS